ncbi:hypothetical protein DAI22_08g150850 [Oryza sativa Japonica Group]|nr:hypothetical protein DAI22_08g150850 [Oryza sativa Japonica Group]
MGGRQDVLLFALIQSIRNKRKKGEEDGGTVGWIWRHRSPPPRRLAPLHQTTAAHLLLTAARRRALLTAAAARGDLSRSLPKRLAAMRMPPMAPSTPHARRAAAKAISMTGAPWALPRRCRQGCPRRRWRRSGPRTPRLTTLASSSASACRCRIRSINYSSPPPPSSLAASTAPPPPAIPPAAGEGGLPPRRTARTRRQTISAGG